MGRKIKYFYDNEKGSALLLVTISFAVMMTIAGLVLDGGSSYMMKRHLQKTANAAALSSAQDLLNTPIEVEQVTKDILLFHNEANSLEQLDITPGQKVSLVLKKDIPVAFSGFFGKPTATIRAKAAAELRVMGRAPGAAPLGIDDSVPLEFYKQYKLKVDQTGVDTGNFGVLALGGTGASVYEYNLRNGFDDEIGVGDIIETQTGNISGKTRTVIKEKLDTCPYPEGETHHRDCPRIILIPVYTPSYTSQLQLQSVQITGFAYFYVTGMETANDTSIKGMFIKKTGTGVEAPNASFKGAYSIRLTE